MTSEGIAAEAKRLFEDLLTLEVNVVIKSGMTARKIPDPAHALLDIIDIYNTYLIEIVGDVDRVWDPEKDPRKIFIRSVGEQERDKPFTSKVDDDGFLTKGLNKNRVDDVVSVKNFDALREWAVEAELVLCEFPGIERSEEKRIVLKRIFRNCDQIKGILLRDEVRSEIAAHGDGGVHRGNAAEIVLTLSKDDILTIRKVWEMGTEIVVMQTVAQLDGDVVTRVHKGREGPKDKSIREIHQEGVATALSHWRYLMQTVALLVDGAFKSFFSKGSR